MLSESGCRERVTQLLDRAGPDCDVVVVADPGHIGYLSGFFASPATLYLRGQSYLVIWRGGETVLITDDWQADAATSTARVGSVLTFGWYDTERPARDRHCLAMDALLSYLARAKLTLRAVGIESLALPAEVADRIRADQSHVTFRDVTGHLREMRLRKLQDEVGSIRRTIRVGEAAVAAAQNAIQPGATECDLYASAYRAALLEAGEPFSMIGDVLSGADRTAAVSGPPSHRRLQPGDLVILDLGLLVDGYRADLAATLVVAGQATDEQCQRFEVLAEAQAAAEGLLRPGTSTRDIYCAARDVIARAGLTDGVRGHIGHGIGVDHLEAPFIVQHSMEVLHAGNVVTVEPAIYLPGWGGMRIEDDYLITANGCERLSQHFKGLKERAQGRG